MYFTAASKKNKGTLVCWVCLFWMRILFLHLLGEQWNITTILGKLAQQTVLPVMYPLGSEWCFAQDLCQYWWQQQQCVMKWVMDTLLELANLKTFWISTNAMCNQVKFRYLHFCFFHDRHCAVADSCESQLGLTGDLRKKALTTVFLRVTCSLELMFTTNTGKILFFSFIFFGNCQYSSLVIIATNVGLGFFWAV